MNQENPIVSVVVPTYNSAHTIIRAIESVFNQTYTSYEIVVVDDGSTDITLQTLQPYIDQKKITYLYQKNQGCGVARNHALICATGEYVAFLDADDYWHPEKLKMQMDVFAKNKKCVACYTESYMVDPYSTLIWETMHTTIGKPRSGNIFLWLLIHNMITLSSMVVPRAMLDKVGGFTEEYDLMMFADYDLWLKLAPLGEFYAILTPLTFYQTRPPLVVPERFGNHKKIAKVFWNRMRHAPYFLKGFYMVGWGIRFIKCGWYRFVAKG